MQVDEYEAPEPSTKVLLCDRRAYDTLMNEGIRKAKMHFTSEEMLDFYGCRAHVDSTFRPDVVLLVDTSTQPITILKRWEGIR